MESSHESLLDIFLTGYQATFSSWEKTRKRFINADVTTSDGDVI